MLQANNISYQIGSKSILRNCTIRLKPRTFTAIVGSNGAGKSTLLKAITNEVKLRDGSITVNGHSSSALDSKALSRIRAVMPQHTSINFPFSIEQIIEIGRFPHHTSPVENEEIIEKVIEKTRLQSYRGRTYQTLSGGEKQRVQLARIMAQVWDKSPHPKYLLLDEPTSDLDILHQHALLGTARELMSDNLGVLAVLHDLNLAAQYADYLVFMKNGEIVKQGETREVFTKENIETTFNHPVQMLEDPTTGQTIVVSIPNHMHLEPQKEIRYA